MLELGAVHLHENKFRSAYMGEANVENKGYNISIYDKVNMVSSDKRG